MNLTLVEDKESPEDSGHVKDDVPQKGTGSYRKGLDKGHATSNDGGDEDPCSWEKDVPREQRRQDDRTAREIESLMVKKTKTFLVIH